MADLSNILITNIKQLSKNSNGNLSDQQQEQFLKLAEARGFISKVQGGADSEVVEGFLVLIISMISNKQVPRQTFRSIKVFLTFLRNDPNIFKAFKPNKNLIKKMNFEPHILSQSPQEQEIALEFTGFLLRYHRQLDFGDFSESPFTVQRIRRFSEFDTWTQIDEIQDILDQFGRQFDEFKVQNSKALGEMANYIGSLIKEYVPTTKFDEETSKMRNKIQNDIDKTLSIRLTDLDHKRMMSFSMGEEQYKKILQLMLDIEKKIENKNVEVRADFNRELQKINAKVDEPQLDPEKLRANLELQIQNLEQHFKNQFLRRVEIVEDSIDTTIERVDRVIQAVTQQAETSDKINSNLDQYLNNFEKLKVKTEKIDDAYQGIMEQIESRSLRLRKEMQGEIDGSSELLKTHIERMSTEVNFIRNSQLESQTELSELKVNIDRALDEAAAQEKIKRDDALHLVYEDLKQLREIDDQTKNTVEGFSIKFKSALGIIDGRQAKCLDVITKIERDLKQQFEQKMQFLQQNEINLQKDLGVTKDKVREIQLSQSSLVNEIQQKITNFDTYYKQNSANLKKQMKDDRDEVRARLEKLKVEYTPKLNLIDDFQRRLTVLAEYATTSESKFNIFNAEMKKVWSTVFGYKEYAEQISKLGTLISKVNTKQQEMENVWMFFQRFVDEQGHDYLKMVRGPGFSLVEKLNAVEWLARYSEFVTPDTCIMASNYFNEMFTRGRKSNPIADQFVNYQHTSEAIPTIFQKLRSKEQEFATDLITFEMYDEANSQLLLLLQSIVLNTENARMLVKVDGMDTLLTILLCQRTPDDFLGGADGTKVDQFGKLQGIESQAKTLSFVGKLKQEQWRSNQGIIEMECFLPVMRSIANVTISREGVEAFARDQRFGLKILLILTTYKSPESQFLSMKIIKNVSQNDGAALLFGQASPNYLNLVLGYVVKLTQNPSAQTEGLSAIRLALKSESQARLFSPESVENIARLQRMSMPTAFQVILDSVVKELAKYSNFEAAIKRYGVKKNF